MSEKTAYAAVWLDDYDLTFGVYRVFESRGECLDYLAGMVFSRAETLGVKVVDQGARPCRDGDGKLVFPEMTKEQVRDQFGAGNDFGLVLRTEVFFGCLEVKEQVTMGIREVELV